MKNIIKKDKINGIVIMLVATYGGILLSEIKRNRIERFYEKNNSLIKETVERLKEERSSVSRSKYNEARKIYNKREKGGGI